MEQIALEDEGVKAEIAKLQLPEGSVVISDPWPYGMVGTRYHSLLQPTDSSRNGWHQ